RKLPGGEFVAIAASNVTSTAGNCLGSTENIAFADYTAVREGDFETDAPQEYRPGEIFDYMSASFIDGSEGNDSSNSSEGSKGSEGNEANDSNISGAAHGNARGIFRTVSSADLPASGPFSSKG
ncbi:MAG: hypothetical protein HGA22_08135, partial [Clostridiales bacterium]|nr:hypothetical protein [Clostridiales bacterium]